MAIFNEPPNAAGVRINWQLIILACGLSLTLALAGATGMLTPAGTQPPPSAPRSVVRPIDPPRVDRSVRAPVLTFVLNESQEDAAARTLAYLKQVWNAGGKPTVQALIKDITVSR